jgi:uncharacterized membrane protein
VIKEAADSGPLGTAVGAMVGALLGVIGGPAGVVAGASGGTLVGSAIDLFNYGVDADFVGKVSDELSPGKVAIVAEIGETWMTPLDTRMSSLDGVVLRTWRADFEDDQIVKEIAETEADFEQLKAEYAHASSEAKAKLKAQMDTAKGALEQSQKRLKARLEAVEKETNAKIAALDRQVAAAKAEAKEKINRRITALRADLQSRSAKLKQAWALTSEALSV